VVVPVRGRRVRRVIRRIDPWSVLKFSLVFYTCVFVVLLVAGMALWLVARSLGIVENIEQFIGDLFALQDFQFEAGQILRASSLGGAVLVLLGTGANVLACVLYNLISDLVGGVEIAVLEEETAAPAQAPASRSVV
jgi:hypothetical protein